MENLYEYLISNQIKNDLSFFSEEQINEGKIKDGLKKTWQWIKGKFKKKKKSKEKSELKFNSSNNDNNNDNNNDSNNDSIKYVLYDNPNKIKEKIYKSNNLNKDKIDDNFVNKIEMIAAEYGEEKYIIGGIFYIKHDKYKRSVEFSKYQHFDHIFSMQIEKQYFSRISKNLFVTLVNHLKEDKNYKGITLNLDEYNSKKDFYENYFNVIKDNNKEVVINK